MGNLEGLLAEVICSSKKSRFSEKGMKKNLPKHVLSKLLVIEPAKPADFARMATVYTTQLRFCNRVSNTSYPGKVYLDFGRLKSRNLGNVKQFGGKFSG